MAWGDRGYRSCARTSRCAGWRSSTPRSGPRPRPETGQVPQADPGPGGQVPVPTTLTRPGPVLTCNAAMAPRRARWHALNLTRLASTHAPAWLYLLALHRAGGTHVSRGGLAVRVVPQGHGPVLGILRRVRRVVAGCSGHDPVGLTCRVAFPVG